METFAKALKQAVVSKSKEKPLHKDGWYQRRSGSGSEAAVLRLLTAANGPSSTSCNVRLCAAVGGYADIANL